MELVSHIYKCKSGKMYLLESQKFENGKLMCWIGTEIQETRKGFEFVMSAKVFKGAIKKEVLKQIKSEIV